MILGQLLPESSPVGACGQDRDVFVEVGPAARRLAERIESIQIAKRGVVPASNAAAGTR